MVEVFSPGNVRGCVHAPPIDCRPGDGPSLYDAAGALVHSVATDIEPYGIAFSPDGERLAVGFVDVPEVRLYDSNSLDPLPPPDVAGIDNGSLLTVAWSRDGATLYAGGGYQVESSFWEWSVPVVAWGEAGSGPRRILPGGLATVMSLRPLPSGDLLIAAADPWLEVLGADGTARWTRPSEQMDASGQSKSFSVSADGMVVDFGYELWGDRHTRFDLASLTLTADPPIDDRTAPPLQEGLDIHRWQDTDGPTLEGVPLPLSAKDRSHSLAIHPDGGRFVLGTEWWLRSFDADGTELWSRSAPGVVWAVNITGDGRLVVAAYGDGTIRWHRVEDGVEILAFFPIIDGENWVAWTPEGVYTATPGARRVLRWHVNRGWDHAAEAVPVSQIPETHRPEVIPYVLPQLGTAGAIAVAELAKIRAAVQSATQAAVGPGARLHVVAVGVSEYGEKAKHLRLDFAHADASDLASALFTSQSGLYAEVIPQLLRNRDATRGGILRALDTAEKAMAKGTGTDLAVVHFSGHGAMIDGMFYLLPHDLDAGDPVAIEATALAADQFQQKVAKLARHGRVIVLLDACRSGATTAGGAKLETDVEVLRALMRSPNVTVLTSSSAGEDSREDRAWGNGAFTKVVLEALTTAADSDRNGVLSMHEMSQYIQERVPQITGGQQTPGVDLRFGSNVFVAGL